MQVIFVGYSRIGDSCAMGDFVVPSGNLLENGVAEAAKACVEKGESICPGKFSLRPKEVHDSRALHLLHVYPSPKTPGSNLNSGVIRTAFGLIGY